MENTVVCLNCLHTPCLCGEQYKQLTDYQYNLLLFNLSKLRDNVDVHIGGKDIVSIMRDIPDNVKYLFTEEETSSMPKTWQQFLNENSSNTAKNVAFNVANLDVDKLNFPSGLLLALIIRSYVPQKQMLSFLHHWLSSRQDEASIALAAITTKHLSTLADTMNAVSQRAIRFNSIPEESLGDTGKLIRNSTIAFNRTLRSINDSDIRAASANLNVLMRNLVCCDITAVSTDHVWDFPEFNNDIFYVDESFRQSFINEKIEFPDLKIM